MRSHGRNNGRFRQGRGPGPLCQRSGGEPRAPPPRAAQPPPHRLRARPRPHHPRRRLSPPQAQDPGLRGCGGGWLPHPPHPLHRGGAGGAHPRRRPGARHRPDRGGGAGARPRPPALRPHRRGGAGGDDGPRMAASTTTRRRSASSPHWSATTPPSTGSTSPGRRWKASPSTTAPCSARPPGRWPTTQARHDLELTTHAGPEAQVAAVADDIAYNHHDLHDGLRAGLFAEGDLARLPLVGPAFAAVRAAHPRLDGRRRRHEALRAVFGAMVEDVIATTRANLAALAPALRGGDPPRGRARGRVLPGDGGGPDRDPRLPVRPHVPRPRRGGRARAGGRRCCAA